jgi:hypothetical protein
MKILVIAQNCFLLIVEDVHLEGRAINWILEINIMKFISNIMLFNIVDIKGISY